MPTHDDQSQPSPNTPLARFLIVLLTLPSFLILTTLTLTLPGTLGPPTSALTTIATIILCGIIGSSAAFTGLVLIWAICKPRWLNDLRLASHATRLILLAGIATTILSITTFIALPLTGIRIVMAICVLMGIWLVFIGLTRR